jgi:hypothetical protein
LKDDVARRAVDDWNIYDQQGLLLVPISLSPAFQVAAYPQDI